MEFKKDLVKILEEMAAMGNFKSVALKSGNIRCYIAFIRIKFDERGLKPVPAKNLIRAMQEIYEADATPENVKAVLAEIFADMDPRDSQNRFGECDCPTCKPDPNAKKEFLEKLKKMTSIEMKFVDVDGFGRMTSKANN